MRKPLFISKDVKLGVLIKEFKKGRSHMALVSSDPSKMRQYMEQAIACDGEINMSDSQINSPVQVRAGKNLMDGLITLEDVIEAIIKDEIYDENDYDRQMNSNISLDTSIGKYVM